MPSKSPKRSVVTKSIPAVTTPYVYVSADHADFEGFVKELLSTLRLLGIHATYDPSLEGSDTLGIVMSPELINPELLSTELNELMGGLADDNDYAKEFIPPPALFKKGDIVTNKTFAGDMQHGGFYPTYRVSKLQYVNDQGWLYTLTSAKGKRPYAEVEEDDMMLIKP